MPTACRIAEARRPWQEACCVRAPKGLSISPGLKENTRCAGWFSCILVQLGFSDGLARPWIALGRGTHAAQAVQRRPTEVRGRLAAVVVAQSAPGQARHTGNRLAAIVVARRAWRKAGRAGRRFSTVVIRATGDRRRAAASRRDAATLATRRTILARRWRHAQRRKAQTDSQPTHVHGIASNALSHGREVHANGPLAGPNAQPRPSRGAGAPVSVLGVPAVPDAVGDRR
jgi:hypothetical protein